MAPSINTQVPVQRRGKADAVSSEKAVLPEAESAFDPAMVAQWPSGRIRRMTDAELIRVIHLSRTPAACVRLEYLDRASLQRLALLAWYSCRNQSC